METTRVQSGGGSGRYVGSRSAATVRANSPTTVRHGGRAAGQGVCPSVSTTMTSGRGLVRSAVANPVRRSVPPPPISGIPSARHNGYATWAATSHGTHGDQVAPAADGPCDRGDFEDRAAQFGVAHRPGRVDDDADPRRRASQARQDDAGQAGGSARRPAVCVVLARAGAGDRRPDRRSQQLPPRLRRVERLLRPPPPALRDGSRMAGDALRDPEPDRVAFLLAEPVRAVRAQIPLAFQTVGATAAVQPGPVLRVRARAGTAAGTPPSAGPRASPSRPGRTAPFGWAARRRTRRR